MSPNNRKTSGSKGSSTERVRQAVTDVMNDAVSTATERAGEMAGRAKDQAGSTLAGGKDSARRAGRYVRGVSKRLVGKVAGEIATRAEQLAGANQAPSEPQPRQAKSSRARKRP